MLLELGSAIAVIVVGVFAGMIRSLRDGYLSRLVDRRDEQDRKVNGKLDEIHDLAKESRDVAEESRDQAAENGDRLDDLAETMVLLHRDDQGLDESTLRDRAGVDELDADLYEGGN